MRAALVLLLLLGACSRRDGREDQQVLLALAEAKALQRRAELHQQGGALDKAIADVKAVLEVRFPSAAPEAEATRLDARAQLARLYLALARGNAALGVNSTVPEDQALAMIEAGRKEVTRDSFFSANLESVAAEVLEARAQRSTDPAQQSQARKEAMAALTRAIEIERRLQARLLREPQ